MGAHHDKDSARELARVARRAIPAEDRAPLSRAACDRLLALPVAFGPHAILGYGPTAEEIDPWPALDALQRQGALVALPRITGPGTLSLHVVSSADELEEGPFGLWQPAGSAVGIAAHEIDLAIVPGVAFDPLCGRVGHGGGYYDRLLALMPQATFVGFAFDGQVLHSIACDAHDVRMDFVVTPTRTLENRMRRTT